MKENTTLPEEISTNSNTINSNQSPKIYHKEYKTINSTKMLESIKEVFTSGNYSLSKLYLFLLKMSNQNNYFGIKLQTIYYQSEIALKEKSISDSLQYGHKIISWINSLDIKKYNNDVVTILIRVLLNSSQVCQDEYPLISCWFLFTAKNILMKYQNKNSELNDEIKTKFPFIIKKLTNNLDEIKKDILNKKSTLIKLGNDIKIVMEKYEKDRDKYLKEIKSDKFFIVNKKWINDFIAFADMLNNENIDKNSLFQTNPLCLMYFSTNNEEQEENKGIYCGEINNFLLINPKSFWPDSLQKYSNIFLDKSKSTNLNNFLILEEDIYTNLKSSMGINYEIERINDNKYSMDKNINLYDFKIMYLNEEIRDKGKENIIIKHMQINENDDINNLIEKIKRGFIGFLSEKKYDISEYDYKIYLCNYNRQDIIDIILFYTNLLEHYKIKGVQINTKEFINNNKDINVLNLFDEENSTKFICCEAINKNSIVLPFLVKYDLNKILCSTCNKALNLNEENNIVFCDRCPHNIYCSEKCKKSDDSHIEYHQKIAKFFEISLKYSDFDDINLNTFLDKNSRKGLTGLINFGNSDFLLATIQALSCCEIFIKYILTQSHKYLNDKYLAKDNSSLISCYSELVYQMWVGTNKEINPSKFKDVFFNQIFKANNNTSNLDILDIFIILLEKLHNELNNSKKKEDEEESIYYPQQIGESDGQAALRWWKLNKELNNSIITDLFQGQLKLKISCPICKWGYVTYPPFYFLNIPLPNKDEMTKSSFRVFPYSNNDFNYVEISYYNINKFTSILDMKNKIKQYKMFSKSNLEAVLFENNELVEILENDTLIYDYVYPRYDFSDEYFIDYEISFIEKPEIKNDEINIYITPIVFEEEKGWFYTSKNIISITYCKLFTLKENSTIRDLQKEIFKYYRKSIDDKYKRTEDDLLDDSYYIEFYQKLNDEKYIEEEFNKYLNENEFFDIYIYHNLPKNSNWIFPGATCEFCGYSSSRKKFCKLDTKKTDVIINDLIEKIDINRALFLLVDFHKYEYMFKNFYSSYIDEKDPHMCLNQDITIYDCLDIYSYEKKLKGEKNFICSRCGRNVIPNQIKYPYSPPKYLILGLKRIKKNFEDLTEMINNVKDDRMVGYPLENFDASPYFINKNKKYNYNLKSVILHCGTIKKCKYKAIVKNSDNWYEIDDNNIKEIDIDDVINQNAYILVYEKTDNDINDESNEEKKEENIRDKNNKDNSGNKSVISKNKKGKKMREEEELLNNEEMFGIKTFGQIEDI